MLVSSASKYLDAEDEGQNVRPAEDGDDADAAEDSDGAVLVGVFLSPPSGAPPRRTRSMRFRVQASYNLGSIFLNKTSGQIWDQKSQTSYNLG